MLQKTFNVLLVEDDAIIALSGKLVLEQNGFSVTTVHTGESAISEAASYLYDFIIMDIDLGNGINGLTAAKRIVTLIDIPIVFISSFNDPEIIAQAEEISGHEYLTKTGYTRELVTSIRRILAIK